jgi:hypothetical protein
MTLRHQQYADLSDNAYVNRRPGTRSPGHREFETIHGVRYEILEHYRNPADGYAGTIYQRMDTGDIVVAHRGTEVKNIPGIVMDLAYTDGSMVLGRVNPQAQDAIDLTLRAIQKAEDYGSKPGHHTPEVTVTGHSLGGCLAQITAHHFDLRGETFNAYGAASLGLRIPEGGDRVLNHVMSADLVNAASPHYGQVRVYASQKEIEALDRLGYDNNHSHFDVRLKGMQPIATIGSHFMSNFTDDNPSGRSILADPDALARAHRYEGMIDKAREDMREQRGAFSVASDVVRGLAGAAPAHHAPLAPGEPALRAGEVRERVETPPLPAYLREGAQAPDPAQPSHPAPSRDVPRLDAPERMAYPPVPDYLRDADRTSSLDPVRLSPSITDRDHPGNARYQQALDAIERSPNIPSGTFAGERMQQAAANLAFASLAGAERPQGGGNEQLDRIDFVVFNKDRSGLIAGQGELGDPAAKLAFLPAAHDNATTLTQASQQVQDTLTQQQTQSQAVAQQQMLPTQDDLGPKGPRLS